MWRRERPSLALSGLLIALCSVDGGALQEPPDGRYLISASRLSFPPGSGFWKPRVICVERLVGPLCQQEANFKVVSEGLIIKSTAAAHSRGLDSLDDSVQNLSTF